MICLFDFESFSIESRVPFLTHTVYIMWVCVCQKKHNYTEMSHGRYIKSCPWNIVNFSAKNNKKINICESCRSYLWLRVTFNRQYNIYTQLRKRKWKPILVELFHIYIYIYHPKNMVSVIHQMKEKFLRYKDDQKLWPWNSCMTEHIHLTKTRPQIKHGKIAQAQCLLIPRINNNSGLFSSSKARNSIKFFISPRNMR